jgi:hypothetical protein
MGSRAAYDGRSTSLELFAALRTSRARPMALLPRFRSGNFAPLVTNPVARGFFGRIGSEPPILQPLLGREKFARVLDFEACTLLP